MTDISCAKFRWPGLHYVYITDSKGVVRKTSPARSFSSSTMTRRSGRAGSVGI